MIPFSFHKRTLGHITYKQIFPQTSKNCIQHDDDIEKSRIIAYIITKFSENTCTYYVCEMK